ncbi:hypothetical protein [Achromobacter denitrificans]|uniref:hypothetical protein n=1 Tax=Achromobacter denitrificans TaxID=32002 RepID=UPI001669156E|nr:hypothetical protein [Achromobacter denitrificans]
MARPINAIVVFIPRMLFISRPSTQCIHPRSAAPNPDAIFRSRASGGQPQTSCIDYGWKGKNLRSAYRSRSHGFFQSAAAAEALRRDADASRAGGRPAKRKPQKNSHCDQHGTQKKALPRIQVNAQTGHDEFQQRPAEAEARRRPDTGQHPGIHPKRGATIGFRILAAYMIQRRSAGRATRRNRRILGVAVFTESHRVGFA